MSPPEDHRRDRRIALILQVQYPDQEGYIADSTENLCAGGAFVRTDRALAMGDRIPLSLSFPGLLEPVSLIGVVAWIRTRRGDEPAGVGIKIPEDRPADRQRLGELVGKMKPRPASEDKAPVAPSLYRVLIVEDNPHLSDMYAYVIRKMEKMDLAGKVTVEVAMAEDGYQAWQKLSAQKFDLVLADMYMPVMDGFALIEKMRGDARLKGVPVVAISAGDAQAKARAQALGATTYLRKPVRFVEVLETVRSLLNLRV